MNWIVYILRNPRTQAVKYVGWTSRAPEARLQSHLYESITSHRTRKERWFLSLLSIGLEPSIEVIESGFGSAFKDAERYWIAFYRVRGADLVNETDGGDGPTAGFWGTPEQRSAAIVKANASRTPEQRRAIIAKVKATMTREERAANIRKTNAAMTFEDRSAAMKKAKANMGPDRVAAVMKIARAKMTPEQISARNKQAAQAPRPNSVARWAALRLAKKADNNI